MILRFIVLFYLTCGMVACSFTKKVKDGEAAYSLKQFKIAIELLHNEVESSIGQNKARKAYLLGKSYAAISDYNNALVWMNKALTYEYNPLAYKDLGLIYKYNENYLSAIEAFENYGKKTNNISEAEREIRICREVMTWDSPNVEYTVDRMLENSFSSDYNPIIYEKDFLVFSSDRSAAAGSDLYNWTGEKFSDFFIMLKNGSDVRKFDAVINSNHNEGAGCFTRDFEQFYFTRCFNEGSGDDYCKIMLSQRVDGFFTDPVVLPFIKEKVNYGHPALFENDSILIFSTDLGDPGMSYDLYYSELDDNGNWADPEPLPSVINSPGNEKFPTTHHDTLYFSSDYLPGLGGLDIFKTYLRKDRSWATPVNMKAPVNSGGDDFGLIVDDFARLTGNMIQKGYFSSVRKGSGKDDIYIFTRRPIVQTDTPEIATEDNSKIKRTLYLAGRTLENQYSTFDDPSSPVTGQTLLTSVNLRITDEGGNVVLQSNTGVGAIFAVEILEEKTYSLFASKPGFLNRAVSLTTDNIIWKEGESSHTVNLDILLQKIYTDREITLQNIYYEYDKWDITPIAKPTLDELANMLQINPKVNIELSSHTDCRGEREYNQLLSQRRAQSAVEYLISKGVNPERLIAKGYGKDRLLIECECRLCTEEEHQLNRRTAFRILQ